MVSNVDLCARGRGFESCDLQACSNILLVAAHSVKRIEGINSVGSFALTAFEKHYVSIPFIKHVLVIP